MQKKEKGFFLNFAIFLRNKHYIIFSTLDGTFDDWLKKKLDVSFLPGSFYFYVHH